MKKIILTISLFLFALPVFAGGGSGNIFISGYYGGYSDVVACWNEAGGSACNVLSTLKCVNSTNFYTADLSFEVAIQMISPDDTPVCGGEIEGTVNRYYGEEATTTTISAGVEEGYNFYGWVIFNNGGTFAEIENPHTFLAYPNALILGLYYEGTIPPPPPPVATTSSMENLETFTIIFLFFFIFFGFLIILRYKNR